MTSDSLNELISRIIHAELPLGTLSTGRINVMTDKICEVIALQHQAEQPKTEIEGSVLNPDVSYTINWHPKSAEQPQDVVRIEAAISAMGTGKALIESKKQAKLGIAPEAAGLEPRCDQPVPASKCGHCIRYGAKQCPDHKPSGYSVEKQDAAEHFHEKQEQPMKNDTNGIPSGISVDEKTAIEKAIAKEIATHFVEGEPNEYLTVACGVRIMLDDRGFLRTTEPVRKSWDGSVDTFHDRVHESSGKLLSSGSIKPVSIAVCAAASYRACVNHYNGTHDPLHNPEAVHTDIAKAVLDAAGVMYAD